MRFGSVCSGIEAASVAWHPLGWRAAFVSEIEPFPCAILAHHYPDVPNFGDMTKFKEWPDADVDVLVGGTPCQSFSVAGLRKGMADPRGNLTLTFLGVVDRYRPRWVVWENVPGVLSIDEGRAFGSFLGGLAQLGYGFAYRILDAQYIGVPQRRRRVFVVGHLGSWQRAAAVLFERASLRGDPPPSRKAGQRVAGTLKGGAGERGYPDPSDGNGGGLVGSLDERHAGGFQSVQSAAAGHQVTGNPADVVGALCADSHPGSYTGQDAYTGRLIAHAPEVAGCVTSGEGKRYDVETTTMVAHSLRAEGFDASEDGTGRGVPLVPAAMAIQERAVCENPDAGPDGVGVRDDGQAYTLEARATVQAVAFAQNSRDEVRVQGGDGQVVGSLAAEPGMKQTTYIAFSAKDHAGDAGEVSPTLRSGGHSKSHANGGVMPAVAIPINADALRGEGTAKTPSADAEGRVRLRDPGLGVGGDGDPAGTVAAAGPGAVAFQASQSGMRVGEAHATLDSHNGSRRHHGAVVGMQVRRLTPTECERLQEFPDGYTLITVRGKPAADGPRYKALGNSMHTGTMRWIGTRIALVEGLVPLEQEVAA